MRLSLSTARRIALRCQGLDGRWSLPSGKECVAQAIERLGYVQIDTIHVVERAHHHVLWSRCPDYEPSMLHELLAEDRRVFEWWTHAASYIPVSDFRYYAPRMGERAVNDRQRAWMEEHQEVMARVLARIRKEGPLGAADFKAPDGFSGGSWWSGWKPAKRALEVYFNLGTLMVHARDNFQRLYDLRERVIPEGTARPVPDKAEMQDFIVRRAVGSLGVVPESQVVWWRSDRAGDAAVARAVEAGLITPVELEDREGETWYAWTAALERDDDGSPRSLHILSPFDNLIIRRPLMEKLFAWDYRLECYLPAEKRTYGYFALPILWGDRFIGRVDTKADRKAHTLIVRQLTFEPDFAAYDEVLLQLADRLREFARFNACDAFAVEQVDPPRLVQPLARALG